MSDTDSISFVDFYRRARERIVAAGQTPVKATYDPATGNCVICGKCVMCPGWHAASEVKA
jgi:hypothetical protein